MEKPLQATIGAKVMLIMNIDIEDRLINGQVGKVSHIDIAQNNVEKVYINFFDLQVPLNVMTTARYPSR